MNENKNLSSIPAYIYNFKDTKAVRNKFITPAKLKVFYKGTTADKRTFTEEFSNELLETLPLVPVVAFYSEEDEDFKGHNRVQNIYGVVPDTAEYDFETDENGVIWAITDVVLYTGRKDNIGEIANKIIGKQHSLEMDPDTLEYEMIINGDGKIKEIVFKHGFLIGLSVLGDNEKPAFTGSSFFTAQEVQDMIKEFVSFNDINLVKNGGFEMNKFENFSEKQTKFLESFLSKTITEATVEIKTEFYNSTFGEEHYIVDVTEDFNSIIAFNYSNGNYFKFSKSENGFTEEGQVWLYFLTQPEIDSLSSTSATQEEIFEENEEKNEEENSDCSNSEDEEVEEEENEEKDFIDTQVEETVDEENTENCSSNDSTEENGVDEIEIEVQSGCNCGDQETVNSSSLNDEERQELEAYRNKEKELIIEKYSKYLSEEEKTEYLNSLKNYTKESLNSALAVHMSNVIFAQEEKQKEAKHNQTGLDRSQLFQLGNTSINEDENLTDVERLIKKYNRK